MALSRQVDDAAREDATKFGLWHQADGLRLERRGAIARIVLDRPTRLNAVTVELAHEMRDALRCCEDPDIRVVYLTGAGRAFCAGADLSPDKRPDPGEAGRATYAKLVDGYQPAFAAIRALPKPVVAAVNGPAVGVGCSLALCCDLVLAAESAFFLLGFVNVGLVPDGGASVWVPRRIGVSRALEMSLLGERIPARQAVEWGLANRVFGDTEFEAAATAVAERLAQGPTRAYAGIKRLTNTGSYGNLEHQFEREARLQGDLALSADHREGVAAFRERRAPRFQGR